jgi:N4-gp56 family major capsid protein
MPTMQASNFNTTTSGIDPTQSYYDRLLLMNSEYYLFHSRWSSKRGLSKRSGQTIILRRYAYFAQALGALTEGEPPAGKSLVNTDFSAVLQQNGDFVAVTDFAEKTVQDEVLNVAVEKLGKQAGYTMDSVNRDVAVAGTSNITYSNGTTRAGLNTIIDGNDLDRHIRGLIESGARMMMKGSAAMAGQGTRPAMAGYPSIISPRIYNDIQNVSNWQPYGTYGASKSGMTFDDEVGRYKNLVFFLAPDADSLSAGAKIFASGGASSTLVTNTAGTVDVHTVLTFGEEFFTEVPLDGESTGTIMKPRGSAGTADPLNQVGTAGWITTSARLITNQSWGGRIECAVSL